MESSWMKWTSSVCHFYFVPLQQHQNLTWAVPKHLQYFALVAVASEAVANG
jgi:hypothetical protein